MISGVAGSLLGEATVLGSPWLVAWFGLFAAINAVYVPLVEEPGLARRYGHEYRVYRDHVPALACPRLSPFDRAGRHPESVGNSVGRRPGRSGSDSQPRSKVSFRPAMARAGIEPATPRFSAVCSTD